MRHDQAALLKGITVKLPRLGWQQKPWSTPSAEQAEATVEAARESLVIDQASLHKRTFPHRKEKSNVYAVWRVAKRCCSIEHIGDTFLQCWSARRVFPPASRKPLRT